MQRARIHADATISREGNRPCNNTRNGIGRPAPTKPDHSGERSGSRRSKVPIAACFESVGAFPPYAKIAPTHAQLVRRVPNGAREHRQPPRSLTGDLYYRSGSPPARGAGPVRGAAELRS